MEAEIIAMYRKWQLIITDNSATAIKTDGSEERFECYGQPSVEAALGAAHRKVKRLEGPEVWDHDYTDGALR